MHLLERLDDNLTSIGDDPDVLAAFKAHAFLPPDPAWTEDDARIKSYLIAAEALVDELSGYPYRPRSYTYTLDQRELCWSVRNDWRLKLPCRPIVGIPTVDWTAADGTTGTYTAGTEFSLFGATSLTPLICFPQNFSWPDLYNVSFPLVVNFDAGGGTQFSAVALTCIFEAAAAYYRNPEMITEKQPFISLVFDANLTLLMGSFLGG